MPATIALVQIGARADALERLRAALPGAWPGLSAPKFVAMDASSIIDGGENLPACVYVIQTARDGLDGMFFKVVDALQQQVIPALVLVTDLEETRSRLLGDDLVVVSADEPIDRLAARLHTLWTRQEVVRRLMDELRVARRFQCGLRGQITQMHEELQLAAIVQREFLPKKLPEVNGVSFGVFFRPAAYVSGDIYNVERLDEHCVSFFLADAVGHGVPAALMTMVIARSLVSKEITADGYRLLTPAEVLSRLNQELVRHQGQGGRFATAVHGVIDSRTKRVTLATAGHPAPLRIRSGGVVEPVETSGGLLGVFPDETYEEASFDLGRDERLVVYSDGFETAFPNTGGDPASRRLPTARYLEQFRRVCETGGTAAESAAALAALVDSQVGSLNQIDDMTAICVGCVPAAGAAADADATIGGVAMGKARKAKTSAAA